MDELDNGLSWDQFSVNLAGLSDQSRWRQAAGNTPVEVTGHHAVSAVLDRM